MVLASMEGEPSCLQLPQGIFGTPSLLLPAFCLLSLYLWTTALFAIRTKFISRLWCTPVVRVLECLDICSHMRNGISSLGAELRVPQMHSRSIKWEDAWLSHGIGASPSASPLHPTFTRGWDVWTSARALPSHLLPKLGDSARIIQEVCGKGVSPEPASFPSPPLLTTVLVLSL